MKRRTAAVLLTLTLVAGSGSAVFVFLLPSLGPSGPGCAPVSPGSFVKGHVASSTFGAVTEFRLPSQDRWPNAITAAPDGSVWFVEEEVPGVAHLYPNNGTLVEYAWEGYPTPKPPDCLYATLSSGIALWQGKVWAADEFGNAIVGTNPSDGSTVKVNTTEGAAYPYWLAVGPDGNLWFTSDNYPGTLGKIYPNMTLSIVKLLGIGKDEPIQLDFVNSSLAFLSAVDESENSTTKACVCTGHVYSFDPSTTGAVAAPSVVGGSYVLSLPTSVSYSDGRIWVAQHGPSSVVSYDFASGLWTKYPTSRIPWSTTLPLVTIASGSGVWFNEHYANKIAFLDGATGTLTEISESNPPASGPSGIQNDESISLADAGLWFTSESGNYVGLVDAQFKASVQVAPSPPNGSVTVIPGQTVSLGVRIDGSWAAPLVVNVSDSENYASAPNLIHIVPEVNSVPAGSSYLLNVSLTAKQGIAPGRYVVAVTIADGGVQQTAYLFVNVKPPA